MSKDENKELVRRFLEEVLNERHVLAIPEFMIPGSMFAGAFEGFITNVIQVGFPDFHVTIDAIFADDNKVVAQTTIAATQIGPAMGYPPTGKSYTTACFYLFKIANAKIVSGQWVSDRLAMAQRLGWMPTPGQAQE